MEPCVVHPGINLLTYEPFGNSGEPDTVSLRSLRTCVLSYVHCVPYAVLRVRPTVLSKLRDSLPSVVGPSLVHEGDPNVFEERKTSLHTVTDAGNLDIIRSLLGLGAS